MYYILDCTAIENQEDFSDCVGRFDDLQSAVIEYLDDFYEIRSDYGNPIDYLVKYIPENNYEQILNDFHYLVANSEEELYKKYKNGELV